MTQKQIFRYYAENGGLRCARWSLKEIREYVKRDIGARRIYRETCQELKDAARY